ncbi:uncharacterized protein KNAG_0J01590 [Huiozyma naganishii CBS 8797]|uniref:non-specific serine/threonine protein kinase n=1 Tax=Huiozyma naganishii (strain ATCC MYA-139 / BCRC 22969 / CBS 8797 / KCTC 17520 / NBRC 10181 / NCYC 3082 / Yp74L-3) TaxID=1071383 RepID=J7RBI4_HUIN7|nr:hypothetical protein KNAG_0J01590 [Kazachstania naganishii CBS 8797]CCK72240.1 hypothetical protein KNAG_0J01590 [Kazachstania naganishii CBS 8797]
MSTASNRRHTFYGGNLTSLNAEGGDARRRKTGNAKCPSFGPYLIGSTLGQGGFGKVKMGWTTPMGNKGIYDVPKQVAIKLIKRDSISNDKSKEVKIYREINALKQLHHPNIVKLEEVLQNSKYIGIVLEYASGGEFYKYIQKRRVLKEHVACRLFAQLISGVHYIHSKGLVHRDLKLENLLLDKHENLIITDFGFVNEYFSQNELMTTSCGSPCYAAPELVISTQPYQGRRADLWSCGIILFAMLAGYLPWDDDKDNPDGEDIAKLYYYITHTALKFPEYITPIPRDLLRRILVADPRRRVTLREIQGHQWLKKHAQFLSIQPEEWDRISQSKNITRLPKHNKHYSTRPLSVCSVSSTSSTLHKKDKRDSLIIDSALITFPAPPRENQSHVLAIPSSPSPEIRRSRSPTKSSIKGHCRSNSAASIALQAVVDAEREQTKSVTNEDDLPPLINNIQADEWHPKIMHSSPSFGNKFPMDNSPVMQKTAGFQHPYSTLTDKENVINETNPVKPACGKPGNSETTRYPPPTFLDSVSLHPSQTSTGPVINSTYQYQQSGRHLYHSNHRKPRPTSYYPGLFSPVMEHGPAYTLTSTSPVNVPSQPSINYSSSSRLATSPFDSIVNLGSDTAITSTKSCEVSPKLSTRRSSSFTDKASLETSGASGDLIQSKHDIESLIKKVQERTTDSSYKVQEQVPGANGQPLMLRTKKSSRQMLLSPENKKRYSLFSMPTSEMVTPGSRQRNRNSAYVAASYASTAPVRRNKETNETEDTLSELPPKPQTASGATARPDRNSTAKRVIDFFKRKSMKL